LRAGASAHAQRGSWPCGTVAGNPSLLLGSAGIGHAYFRLHDPSIVSVLSFDPDAWGCS
jgi:hypothetical protein